MSEEEKQLQQKQEEQDASKKALKTGAKAAANAYAGPIGGKAVDLASKTKLGDDILNKGAQTLNKNPAVGKIANAANKTGALDAADKAVDTAGGNVSGGQASGLDSNLDNVNKATPDKNNDNEDSNNNDIAADADGSTSLFDGFGLFSKNNKKKMYITIGASIVSFLIVIIIVLASASTVLGPIYTAKNFVEGLWNGIVDFFTTNQREQEEKYYNALKDAQNRINDDTGGKVCIDVNLITATLSIYTTPDKLLDERPDLEEIEPEYKEMTKQVNTLANMQIMSKMYALDKEIKESTGSYCSANVGFVTVDRDNYQKYSESFKVDNEYDSSTYELIASHDMGGLLAFFTKKADEEKNYAYYLYYPPFDSEGNCSDDYAEEVTPLDSMELSIGTYETRYDSVYYWNLVNSFIPSYYADYLPNDESEKLEAIKKIADEIYLLYDQIGPSQTCAVAYSGPSNLCPNGITIENVGTIDFEEYIAGVVSREAYTGEGMEALKAQAVAARTYALNYTNYCTKAIQNSTNAQTFTRDINDRAREATNATSGEVLINRDGSIFSAQYDSFCYDDNDCPDAVRNNNGTYTVTYTKVPYGEKHTITLSDSDQYGRITHGQGHAHGMSQLLSYQMAKEGKNYRDILSYFYSEGVSISAVSSAGGSGSAVAGGSAQQKLAYLFPAGLPSSNAEASVYMTTVQFPVVDINGNRSTKRATVHQAIAQDFVSIMTEIADSGFPIKDVGCYNWRNAAASQSRSHHSYGVACDLNSNENYMIKNGQVVAGSYYRPGSDPYSFPANGIVVRTFAKYGWGWGGSWNSSKDYMHFSFTNY